MEKKCGVLLPVFALPSKYGIGTFGKWAYKFIDLLKETGHSYWQMLPLMQTGFGDSPYSSCADGSGNPYFIDPEILRSEKLLTYREVEKIIDKGDKIDYGKLYNERYSTLRLAFSRFDENCSAFVAFLKRGEFNDYALYMTLKGMFGKPWYEWADEYKLRNAAALKAVQRENKKEFLFWQFVQFEFERQFKELKKYAHSKGVRLIGDLPLYVALDSVDVWTSPEAFCLDENYRPTLVAGVPPDYFSETGQLWGNPVYNYEVMAKDGFSFWKKRVDRARKLFDLVRIDHFRGLDRFYAVPAGSPDARGGEWFDAPKMELLKAVGTQNLIAEDLGLIDDGVKKLLAESGLCGLKVLLFAFGGDDTNPYLPWNISENSIAYSGTHDNNTVIGTLKALPKEEFDRQRAMIKKCLDYLKIYKNVTGVHSAAEAVIDIVYASDAKIAIVPIPDLLSMDESGRINTPGAGGSWTLRIKESALFTPNVASLMKRRAKRFSRG